MSSSTASSLLQSINRSHLVTAAGIAGAAFFAYCVYFDNKRRSAPDFRRKLRESTVYNIDEI